MSQTWTDVEEVFRAAINCSTCFEHPPLKRPIVDVAQPRWIGPRYFDANLRVAVVLTNPGSGEGRNDSADRRLSTLLHQWRETGVGRNEVFAHQEHDFPNWGQGRFLTYYINGFGLSMDEVALVNIAWCATEGNRYPNRMLNTCFKKHTRTFIRILDPQAVILGGEKAQEFRPQISSACPAAKLIEVPHYAAHISAQEWADKADCVRKKLA